MNRTVSREDWEAARVALRKEEDAHAVQSEGLARKRAQMPWYRVEKEYTLDAEDGRRTLADLFDGRSQLLAYNIMFGPDYEGACPGCSNLADHLDATLVHLNHRDVTLICFSRAPIEKLRTYKRRMGWKFPWVSTGGSDFPFDFQLALRPEEVAGNAQIQEIVRSPPDELKTWSKQVGASLEEGLAENPSWIAFAREGGAVYQTGFFPAPNRDIVAPYFAMLMDLTPKGRGDSLAAWRKDEYPK